jgi:hypothetical protein
MSGDDQRDESGAQVGINLQAVDCPSCGERMPFVRMPDSMFQMLWGGWTCPNCGCKMDKWGRMIENDA